MKGSLVLYFVPKVDVVVVWISSRSRLLTVDSKSVTAYGDLGAGLQQHSLKWELLRTDRRLHVGLKKSPIAQEKVSRFAGCVCGEKGVF